MSGFYLMLDPIQEPFDMGRPDSSGRIRYVVNIRAMKGYSQGFLLEIIRLLQTAGVGTEGVDLFGSSQTEIPPTGIITVVRETGGSRPDRVHNDLVNPSHQNPTASVICHAPTTAEARAKAWLAYDAFMAVHNATLAS